MTAVQEKWSPVQHVILGEDPELRVYAEVSVWFKKIELFRKSEDERMYASEPTPDDMVIHKNLLQRLIAEGDHLFLIAQQVGFPTNSEGIASADVVASLETLRDDYRGWHEPPTAERRAQVLREVFPDVA